MNKIDMFQSFVFDYESDNNPETLENFLENSIKENDTFDKDRINYLIDLHFELMDICPDNYKLTYTTNDKDEIISFNATDDNKTALYEIQDGVLIYDNSDFDEKQSELNPFLQLSHFYCEDVYDEWIKLEIYGDDGTVDRSEIYDDEYDDDDED